MGVRNVAMRNVILYITSNIYKLFIEAVSGSVISSPFESRIEISVVLDGFMATNDLILIKSY